LVLQSLYPRPLTQIPGTTLLGTVPVNGDWQPYTYTFTCPPAAAGHRNLVLTNAGYLTSSNNWLLMIIDDVTLSASNVTFTPPTQVSVCNNTPVDLSQYVTPTGGTFSGYGVTGNLFYPQTALAASGGNTNIVVIYTYTDGGGCT